MERSTIFKGKLTISMAIVNRYVKLPESICTCLDIGIYPLCICWLIDHDWSISENGVFAISCSLIDLYPIGSMVLVYMLTWLGYIDGIHGAPYIAAPWMRLGYLLVDVSTWHSARSRSLKTISPWASLSRRQRIVCSNLWIEIIPSVMMRPPESLVECGCVWECCVPLNPLVYDHYPY